MTTTRVSVATGGGRGRRRLLRLGGLRGWPVRPVRRRCHESRRGRHQRSERRVRARSNIGDDRARERRHRAAPRATTTRSAAPSPTMAASWRFRASRPTCAAGDTNGFLDVFVRDRAMNTTQRVSVLDPRRPSGRRLLHAGHFGERPLRRVGKQCNDAGSGRYGTASPTSSCATSSRGRRSARVCRIAASRATTTRGRPCSPPTAATSPSELRVESGAGRHERHDRRLRPRPRDGPDGAGERHQRRRPARPRELRGHRLDLARRSLRRLRDLRGEYGPTRHERAA